MKTEKETVSFQGTAVRKNRLKRMLMLFWSILTFAVFGVMILIFTVSGRFSNADQRVRAGLAEKLSQDSEILESCLDEMAGVSLKLSEEAGRAVDTLLLQNGMTFSELNNDPEHLLELEKILFAPVSTALHMAGGSGAYIVLDVSANTSLPEAEDLRSGLYLKCVNITGGHLIDPDVCCFRGASEAARQNGIKLHNRWNPDFNIKGLPEYEAVLSSGKNCPPEKYYWTERLSLKGTWEDAVLLCVPVIGGDGTVYGICGIEISALFFELSLPAETTPFGPVVTAAAPLEDGRLMLKKGLVGGAGGTCLDMPESLGVHQSGKFIQYMGKENNYIGMQKSVRLSMDEKEDRQWAMAVLLPEENYLAYASSVSRSLLLKCTVILLLILACSVLLYRKVVKPIGRELAQDEERDRSAEQELHMLREFVRNEPSCSMFGEKTLPPEIESILEHFVQRTKTLRDEEKSLFLLLLEGFTEKEILSRMGRDRRRFRRCLKKLLEELDVSSLDDILFYIDFFRKSGRMDRLIEK